LKSTILVLNETTKKWTIPIRDWDMIHHQSIPIFEYKISKYNIVTFTTYTLYEIVSFFEKKEMNSSPYNILVKYDSIII